MQKQGEPVHGLIYWMGMLSWWMHTQVPLHCKEDVKHCELLHAEQGAMLAAGKAFPGRSVCMVTHSLNAGQTSYIVPVTMTTEHLLCRYLTDFMLWQAK